MHQHDTTAKHMPHKRLNGRGGLFQNEMKYEIQTDL